MNTEPENGNNIEAEARDAYATEAWQHEELSQASSVNASMGSTVDPARNVDPFATIAGGSADADSDGIGQFGEYILLEELARGGMGVVYKARHRLLDRRVAIKIPLASQLEGEGAERFMREARAAAQLRHPQICPIFEVGHTGKTPFIALGYIDGPTLKQWLKEASPNSRQAAETIAKVARAVHYAHTHDIIHRDIKPSNIMLDEESREPVLMDFGLAKQLGDNDALMTKSGQVMGTPVYMSPEQAAGHQEKIDAATDTYALGAVLYQLLTGKAPFQGTAGEVIKKVQTETPPAPRTLTPTLHGDLETICLKAMAREPAERYATALALAEDLERFCAGEAIVAKREGIVRRAKRALKRHAQLAVALVALLIVIGGAATYFSIIADRTQAANALRRQFDQGLQQPDWPPEHRAQLETLAEQIAAGDAEEAARLQALLSKTYASLIRQDLDSHSTLATGDIARIQTNLDWLEARDESAATRLTARLQQRLSSWQPAFSVDASSTDWAEILPEEQVKFAEGAFVRRRPTADQSRKQFTRPLPINISSTGNARLLAVFAPGWQKSREFGLALHIDGSRGYEFRLSRSIAKTAAKSSAEEQTPATEENLRPENEVGLDEALAADAQITASIWRDGRLLRRVPIPTSRLASLTQLPLTLEATVKQRRVTFAVADELVVEFDDIFPFTGNANSRFGVLWPPNLELESLTGFHHALPVTPSPLEAGDALLVARRWDDALVQYQQQAALTEDAATIEQANYKMAICLTQLDRQNEAVEILAHLASSKDERLQVLASCQLWLLEVRRNDYAAAQIIFENLQSRYTFEELAILVPQDDRSSIVTGVYTATNGINLYSFNDNDVEFLRHSHAVAELLDPGTDLHTTYFRTWQLLRAHHACDQFDAALQVGNTYLKKLEAAPFRMPGIIIEEMSWILRQQQRYAEALALVEKYLQLERSFSEQRQSLLVERARIYAGQGDSEKAIASLEEYLAQPPDKDRYDVFGNACLMRGYFYLDAGDLDAAKQIWRQGMHDRWLEVRGSTSTGSRQLMGMGMSCALLIATLAEELTDAHFAEISYPLVNSLGSGLGGKIFQNYMSLIAPAARRINRGEFGARVCRELAFKQNSLRRYIQDIPSLIFLAASRQGAAPGEWNDEETELLWHFVHRLMDEYREERLGNSHVVQFMLTWKGANNIFGWSALAPALTPAVRGPAAYMYGHRFRKLGKPDDARQFFQTALDNAPPDSPLARLAQAQLDADE